jgi:hypothetical protein
VFEEDSGHYKYNADEKMEHLRSFVQRLVDSDENDHVYMTFGCDFAFTNAKIDYFFLDKVLKHWN